MRLLKNDPPQWVLLLLIAGLGYVWVACLVYQFRHPELTEMQRFFNMWDALRFR